MAVKDWWASDPAERYWMEITNRSELGVDVRAPQVVPGKSVPWHYQLVAQTQPGDLVFHWHDAPSGVRAIVGWSEVVGPLDVALDTWTPHSGPSKGTPVTGPAWIMPLASLHLLDEPITLPALLARRDQVLGVEERLRARVSGPTYFPFTKYGDDGLRAAQAYLTKCPADLVALLESEFGLRLEATERAAVDQPLVPASTANGAQGFLRDAAVRQAIELRAVDVAVEHYKGLGATDIEILGKPYDIRLALDGEERRVEVKGSSSRVDSVFLTKNEVQHARSFEHVDLFLVESIKYEIVDGQVKATGGESTVWSNWTPENSALEAQQYRYMLPALPAG